MTSKPLLSIVIPTRNRAHTALACTQSLLRMEGDDFEVVVRDCSDSSELAGRFADLTDSRLVFEHSAPMSMTDNWNAAMRMTSGRFVSYIGDDDGFMPWGLTTLRALDLVERVDCLASEPLRIVYRWPDFGVKEQRSLLVFEQFHATASWKRQSSREALGSYLRGERDSPPLPGVYHRIASRDLMEEIRKKSGDYFDTMIPDYFTYTLAAGILDDYHLVEPPITIAGSCGSSNSSRVSVDRNLMRLHTVEYGARGLPLTQLGRTCDIEGTCADTIWAALQLSGDEQMIDLFRYHYAPTVCANSICLRPKTARMVLSTLQRNVLSGAPLRKRLAATIVLFARMARFTVTHLDYTLRKLGWYTPRYDKELNRFEKVEDIGQAIDIVARTTPSKPSSV